MVFQEVRARFDVKGKWVGPAAGDPHSAQLFGRVIAISPYGLAYEADLWHAELTVEGVGLEGGKPLSTPGRKEGTRSSEPGTKVKEYRALAARDN